MLDISNIFMLILKNELEQRKIGHFLGHDTNRKVKIEEKSTEFSSKINKTLLLFLEKS